MIDDDHRVDGDDEGDDASESFGASVQVDWEFGNEFLFTSITGYQDWENSVVIAADSLKNPMLFAPQTQSNEVLSQEFRITSPSDRSVEYLAGLYFYKQDTQFDSDLTVGAGANRVFPFPPFLCPAPCTAREGDFVTSAFDQETESIAGYGNVTWHINDTWDVTGGLRWSRDEKDVEIAHHEFAHQ